MLDHNNIIESNTLKDGNQRLFDCDVNPALSAVGNVTPGSSYRYASVHTCGKDDVFLGLCKCTPPT